CACEERTDGSRGRHVHRPTDRHGAVRAQDAPVSLPGQLVVPARRGRALLLHRARRDGHLPRVLLPGRHDAGRLPRAVQAARGPAHDRGVPLGARYLDHRQGGAADPPDAPLGGGRVHRGDPAAPHPRVLHRCVPQAARADLLARRDDAHGHAARGLPRLLARRRPAVGDGSRDRLRRRAVDSVRRRQSRGAALGWAVPGHARVLRADVHRPRLPLPAPDRDPAGRSSHARRAAPPHPVQAVASRVGAQGGRAADVPRADAAVARARLRRRGRALPARRARADQPDLAVGAVPHVLVDERRAARLVPRLADRRPAPDAALGLRDRRLHPRAEPVLGRGVLPARGLRLPLRVAGARAARDRRLGLPQPARPSARRAVANRDRRRDPHVGGRRLPRRLGRPGARAAEPQLREPDLVLPRRLFCRPARRRRADVPNLQRAAGGRPRRARPAARGAGGTGRGGRDVEAARVLNVLEEKLAEAHGLAIAASSLTGTVERHVEDWILRDVLAELRRDADETRRRCLALERSLGSDRADELLAHANTTAEHAGDLVAAWFKAGTDPARAWTFLAMGEAGEVAAWSVLAELAGTGGDVSSLAGWGYDL